MTRYVGAEGVSIAPGVFIKGGTDTPEGNITATPGNMFLRSTGQWYQKRTGTGNTGWVEMVPVVKSATAPIDNTVVWLDTSL